MKNLIIAGIVALFATISYAEDNIINIDQIQSGNNLDLNIFQVGEQNRTEFTLGGSNIVLEVDQQGTKNKASWVSYWGPMRQYGGDIDGDNNDIGIYQRNEASLTINQNTVGIHIQGDDNTVKIGQGYYAMSTDGDATYDYDEAGGHTAIVDVHADNNQVYISQSNGKQNIYSGHSATIFSYADNNYIALAQTQDGTKTFTATVTSEDSILEAIQIGSGSHSASVQLSGTEPTTLNMTQQGVNSQQYSLTQTCVTVGGCSVTVIQGQ